MPKKITEEVAVERLSDDIELISDFRGISGPADFFCKVCGHN